MRGAIHGTVGSDRVPQVQEQVHGDGEEEPMMRGPKESLGSWRRRVAKRVSAERRTPGRTWRIRAVGTKVSFEAASSKREIAHAIDVPGVRSLIAGQMVFDELAIDDWLHLEQMGRRVWWLSLGDRQLVIWIEVPRRGKVRVRISEENGKVR
jgi:hypothetical protein